MERSSVTGRVDDSTVNSALMAQVLSAMAFSMVLPLLPLHLTELRRITDLSYELLIGMAFSAQALAMTLAAPVWGRLADRYGRKRMVLRACYAGAGITTAFALAETAEAIVVISLVQGLLTGTVTALAAMVASTASPRGLSSRMSLLQTGQWLGVALGPALGGVLSHVVGYRSAFLIASGLLAIAGAVIHLRAREVSGVAAPAPVRPHRRSPWRMLVRSGLTPIYALRLLDWLARSLATPFLPLLVVGLLDDGMGASRATGLVFGVSAAAGAVSSLTVAKIASRAGERRLILIGAIVATFAYALHTVVGQYGQLLALQAVTGAASGWLVPSLSTLLARKVAPTEAGSAFGLDGSVSAAGRALAPLLGATLVVAAGTAAPFVASAVVYMLMAILVCMLASTGTLRRA